MSTDLPERCAQLEDEANRLRSAIHTAHDHLHHGRVDDAHNALHCGHTGAEPANITSDDAALIHAFIEAFNALCLAKGVFAACVIAVPSKTDPSRASIQIGGHVPTIQLVRHLMGYGPTSVPR